MTKTDTYFAFQEHSLLAEGSLEDVALALKEQNQAMALVFEAATGRQIDIDLRGTKTELQNRLKAANDASQPPSTPRGRGRPKLGVVGREVTLLPRHWAWLDEQSGGASAALRRFVEQARKEASTADQVRAAQNRAHRFMTAIAGDLPGYEEACRALFNQTQGAFEQHTKSWPTDVRRKTEALAQGVFD